MPTKGLQCTSKMPPSWNEMVVSIRKTEKASYSGSYGPKQTLPHLIHKDQTLFCRDKLMTTLDARHMSYVIFNKPN